MQTGAVAVAHFRNRFAVLELDVGDLAGLDDGALEERAGRGSHEIRTWLIGFAAAGRALAWTSYEPVPEWITGMGIGTTFEVARAG